MRCTHCSYRGSLASWYDSPHTRRAAGHLEKQYYYVPRRHKGLQEALLHRAIHHRVSTP